MASTENTQAASPFGRRWLISGAVVLLALALAVFLAVRGGGRIAEHGHHPWQVFAGEERQGWHPCQGSGRQVGASPVRGSRPGVR